MIERLKCLVWYIVHNDDDDDDDDDAGDNNDDDNNLNGVDNSDNAQQLYIRYYKWRIRQSRGREREREKEREKEGWDDWLI